MTYLFNSKKFRLSLCTQTVEKSGSINSVFYSCSQLKCKSSAVKCIKVGVSFKVKAVKMRGVYILAAGVEGASCGKIWEGSWAFSNLWGSGGQGRSGGAGTEVAQSGGGRCPTHQQTYCPHCPGITAVTMTKAIRNPVRRGHRHTPLRLPQSNPYNTKQTVEI